MQFLACSTVVAARKKAGVFCWECLSLGASSLPMGGEQTGQTCNKTKWQSRMLPRLAHPEPDSSRRGEYGCRIAPSIVLYGASSSLCAIP